MSSNEVNAVLAEHAPAIWKSLSRLGRAAFYPRDIPFQAAQAKATRYNATIGQITDGSGSIVPLPSVRRVLRTLDDDDRNRALLYSPIDGILELRERWHEWQRPDDALPTSLPVVTNGLTHGLSIAADLFGDPGRKVIVGAPFWGNYRQIFEVRTGSELIPAQCFTSQGYRPESLAAALNAIPGSEPAIVILNFPSNPVGYMPSAAERASLIGLLDDAAEKRPVIAICDDAYQGLVYEEGVPRDSLFFDLMGRNDQLVPIRVAGSTKEMVFFGGRVGFLTLPFSPDHEVAVALEDKIRSLIRSAIGSPCSLSQMVLLQALRSDTLTSETHATYDLLAARYRKLKAALACVVDPPFASLPFNSGVFALLELPESLDADRARQSLIADQSTGLVSAQGRYLRIAFCSVAEDDIEELVGRTVLGLRSQVAG